MGVTGSLNHKLKNSNENIAFGVNDSRRYISPGTQKPKFMRYCKMNTATDLKTT